MVLAPHKVYQGNCTKGTWVSMTSARNRGTLEVTSTSCVYRCCSKSSSSLTYKPLLWQPEAVNDISTDDTNKTLPAKTYPKMYRNWNKERDTRKTLSAKTYPKMYRNWNKERNTRKNRTTPKTYQKKETLIQHKDSWNIIWVKTSLVWETKDFRQPQTLNKSKLMITLFQQKPESVKRIELVKRNNIEPCSQACVLSNEHYCPHCDTYSLWH